MTNTKAGIQYTRKNKEGGGKLGDILVISVLISFSEREEEGGGSGGGREGGRWGGGIPVEQVISFVAL